MLSRIRWLRWILLPAIVGLTVVIPPGPAAAALNWVGEMFPAGGSTTEIRQGDSSGFTVYVQVYKPGITEGAGAGPGIQCSLHWGRVGGSWTDQPMTYNQESGNNDQYKITLNTASLAVGTYAFTTWCTDGTPLWQGAGDAFFNIWDPDQPTDARAIWLDESTLAWAGPEASTYRLHYDPDGGLDLATSAALTLTVDGTVGSDYPAFPNAAGKLALRIGGNDLPQIPTLLKGQLILAAYDSQGTLVKSTGVQLQGVLDDLYRYSGELGPVYQNGVPSLKLWAPTAKSVTLHRFANATTTVSTTEALTPLGTSGVWAITGTTAWNQQYYIYEVEVYVPGTGRVERNLVTDPYAVNLSQNSRRSQLLDLDDPALKPAGWDTLEKPALAAPEDITIYEVHVRDFSIQDSTVAAADHGTFRAFTYDGRNGRALSNGMRHLKNLANAGLTHVHLLPVFDIASVDENPATRTDPDPAVLATYPASSTLQHQAVSTTRALDSFNWGYDPYHYGAPEGSYATNPNDTARIREFREMVQRLNENGLRVVMDMVYNHTPAAGQEPFSVLDKIVPGYYYRYDTNGLPQNSSCCSDTATEFAMMEKLMVDTVVRWARDYKVDGFRFDLMNLHTVENMQTVKAAVQGLTLPSDGIDGSRIYLYGEGWDFGSAAAKGLDYANQQHAAGTGIGTFNDRLRDAAHGGYNTDDLQIRHQGFINGLSYDWNGFFYNNREESNLRYEMDRLRVGLAGELQRYQFRDSAGANRQGLDFGGYTLDPQEAVNYVSKHDNETLFDNNVFKAPADTTMAERVRIQNLGLSLVGLAQGVPFFQMGSDMLRSKSLDRNSYDSGDWFNKVDFTYQSNNFGVGLPPAWDNQSRWDIMEPLLANPALKPGNADILAAVHHLSETLRIRKSSPLFRLRTAADINRRVKFYPTGSAPILVMSISDLTAPDLDSNYERIIVLFNAGIGPGNQEFIVSDLIGNANIRLHPVQQASHDPVVRNAAFDSATGAFSIPPRTAAVFVDTSADAPTGNTPPDWVGSMYPDEGVSTPRRVGDGSGLAVYAQVYKENVTGSNHNSTGAAIDCYLHWGRYGSAWNDQPMAFNTLFTANAANDEYFTVIPTGDLPVGNYGYTVYCTGAGNPAQKVWRTGDDGILSITPRPETDTSVPGNPHGVYVHLFEWPWTDVEKECPYLADKGYTAVQVSPPMEHIQGSEWWTRYQPVSYRLDQSRSGTQAQFQHMITTCNALGVDIYVDAVINHMTAMTGTGTAGSTFTKYDYPAVPYTQANFHAPCDISSYGNRREVQHCQLLGLADLDYDNADTRSKIRTYLNGLLAMGVKGFRIDGSKHIAAYDLERVLNELDGDPYLFQEVIESAAEPIQGYEYLGNGDINDFNYEYGLAYAFKGAGTLAGLKTFGSGTDFVPSAFAAVFTNNHDDQRAHPDRTVNYKDEAHDLANVFMLAWPYGYPQVMSSYYFSQPDQGPPAQTVYAGTEGPDDPPARCGDGAHWVCEHRRPAIANMVKFRNITADEPVIYWWDNGADQIAFGRGEQGYVAINGQAGTLVRTFQTGMAPGAYCNVIQGELMPDGSACTGAVITVTAQGQIVNQSLPGISAFAIHTRAKIGPPQPTGWKVYLPIVLKP